jgi:hypothetical protein
MKSLFVIMLLAVLAALASAGLFMLRKNGDSAGSEGSQPDENEELRRSSRMARALAVRVGLSVALFVFILFSWYMGWVRPTGLPVGH